MNFPVRISDVPLFDMCPIMYYFQRVKKYIPPALLKRMNYGTKRHEVFEKEQKDIYDKLPEPEPGKPYIYMIQETLLQDKELNVRGKPDQIIIRGTALNSPDDKRMILVVDKKPKFNKSYLYQLWGYAYLSKKDSIVNRYAPFTIHTAFAYKTIDEVYPFEEHHEQRFVNKVHEIRKVHTRMIGGQIPRILLTEKCKNCFYRDRCSELFKNV